jgi:DNA-binding IscR family transcriptional regulator
LTREADQIRAAEIVEAVEGPVALVHCVAPDGESSCNRVDGCATHLFWKRLSMLMKEFLDATTLQDLADEAQQLGAETAHEGNLSEGPLPRTSRLTIACVNHRASAVDVDLAPKGAP